MSISTILAISDGIKDDAAAFYGEPPYGHAELSFLKTFSKKVGLDLKTSVEQLKQAGYLESNPDSLPPSIHGEGGKVSLFPEAFYMKELTAGSSSSFIICCVRWPDMAVILKSIHFVHGIHFGH